MTDPRILVCDDDTDLREMICEYLGERGFKAETCEDGRSLLEAVKVDPPALAVLDVRMPGMDGIAVLKELRSRYAFPVIMLTAAAETVDRIVGLELGADDYIGKPVDLRELEARIKTVLRRMQANPVAEHYQSTLEGHCAIGPHTLDLSGARLIAEGGEDIPMTAMEFSLLKVLSDNRGRVVTRERLLDEAHERGWDPFDRSIDLRVSRLRKKIERNPAKPEIIKTVRGLGYMLI
ncbi:response regulator [Parvularcula maris]|uniref:Response regulator transcription factor n=1 Tax=Parvularcula maris TaxID=2965077 RepID=A0A9X2RH99_9PROT|nr:response regulator transcription factor [Parvularcula maris]MCQ8184649.1 response regulator transcription factor [Parvularcula maris]